MQPDWLSPNIQQQSFFSSTLQKIENKNKNVPFKAVGLNERLRFLRYDKGHFFAPHADGCYIRDDDDDLKYEEYHQKNTLSIHNEEDGHIDEQNDGRAKGKISFVTCQIYLNSQKDDFEGGSTTFLSESEQSLNDSSHGSLYNAINHHRYEVQPKAGSVLLFDHSLIHEGSLLQDGRKYVIRTDVMYS
mmetsp:Transcript_10897/g.14178  ORF Transcript_10897/g.14178 Transcript_10897/m.14178 type:complete len:188 (-) Transcript_10897:61-624(-)